MVKEGDRSQVPGGCHDTLTEAGKHKAALDAAMEREGEMSEMLAEVQAEMNARGLTGPHGADKHADSKLVPEQEQAQEKHGEREPFVHVVPFSLANAEKRIVYGVVVEPNSIDAQGHTLTAEDVEAACHSFMARLQGGDGPFLDEHHARLVQSDEAVLVESWVQKEPAIWKFAVDGEERETEVKVGSWCAAVKVVDDDLWQQVQDGEITGFSVRGQGVLTVLS